MVREEKVLLDPGPRNTTFCCHFEYIFHFYDEERRDDDEHCALARTLALALALAIHSSIPDPGQLPSWETEINEEPRISLILTTSERGGDARPLSCIRGRGS